MTTLLDVNVLVALAWPNHIHHEAALAWFMRHQSDGWATCPVTESSFVRVSSNRKAIPEARSPAEAIGLLRQITALAHHQFWVDDISMAGSEAIAPERLMGHLQVTDAHLLALAIRHDGRLATFDRGLADLLPLGVASADVLVILSRGD